MTAGCFTPARVCGAPAEYVWGSPTALLLRCVGGAVCMHACMLQSSSTAGQELIPQSREGEAAHRSCPRTPARGPAWRPCAAGRRTRLRATTSKQRMGNQLQLDRKERPWWLTLQVRSCSCRALGARRPPAPNSHLYCTEQTESTSGTRRLNSSKQPQEPEAESPLKMSLQAAQCTALKQAACRPGASWIARCCDKTGQAPEDQQSP